MRSRSALAHIFDYVKAKASASFWYLIQLLQKLRFHLVHIIVLAAVSVRAGSNCNFLFRQVESARTNPSGNLLEDNCPKPGRLVT